MNRIILASALACACIACQPVGHSNASNDFPKGTQKFVAPGNYIVWVVPITLEDGTRCLVAVKNGAGGGGISCSWEGK